MIHSDSRNNASPSRALLGRELRLFAKEVPAALLIAVLLGLFCALAASALSHGAESGYTPAPVAVVDADGSFASSLGISLIAQQDFAAPLQIVKTDRETAEAGLADGRFSAALYLPTGFADDILQRTDAEDDDAPEPVVEAVMFSRKAMNTALLNKLEAKYRTPASEAEIPAPAETGRSVDDILERLDTISKFM